MASVKKGRKTRTLSIFLLKESAEEASAAIDDPDRLRSPPVSVGGPGASLFVKPSKSKRPAWVSFLGGVADLSNITLESSSASGVLILPVEARLVAITFGYGRHLLKPGSCDENFGLRVTLNSIEEDSIRSIDRKSFDTLTRHTREEASRPGSIEQFGLNIEQDLLRAVVGRPSDAALGKRLAGMDAVSATAEVSVDGLMDLVGRYFRQSKKRTYKKRFPWVDQIAEVRDPRRRTELDEELCQKLAANDLDRAWLAVPVPLDWSAVGGFRYSTSRKTEVLADLHLRDLLGGFSSSTVTPEQLRRRPVACFDVDDTVVLEKWPAYQCLYAEVDAGGDLYLLTGGSWYRVASSFVEQVNTDVAALPPTDVRLPPFEHQSEGAYNQAVAKASGGVLALMDAKNIPYGGGASKIEFCDLYAKSRVMVHVKRYSGSSVLSHLFSQGHVAGQLFVQDGQFRKEVNRRLPASHRLADTDTRLRASRYEVAYAIISRSESPLKLPFFSRVNLRTASKTLAGFGYRVSLTKIPSA